MSLMQWQDRLSVHNDMIDGDHKHLIDLINNLHDAVTEGHGADKVGETLDELVIYTATHFKREEEAMQRTGYPDYEAHKRMHDDLVGKVLDYQKKHRAGDAGAPDQVLRFLKQWLTNHIMQIDTKLGAYLGKEGV